MTPVAALCAVAMGARMIERHFTTDKQAAGPDHRLSSDPPEMRWLVDAIRAFEVMRGNGIKQPADSEATTRVNNRKSAARAAWKEVVAIREGMAGAPIAESEFA